MVAGLGVPIFRVFTVRLSDMSVCCCMEALTHS